MEYSTKLYVLAFASVAVCLVMATSSSAGSTFFAHLIPFVNAFNDLEKEFSAESLNRRNGNDVKPILPRVLHALRKLINRPAGQFVRDLVKSPEQILDWLEPIPEWHCGNTFCVLPKTTTPMS